MDLRLRHFAPTSRFAAGIKKAARMNEPPLFLALKRSHNLQEAPDACKQFPDDVERLLNPLIHVLLDLGLLTPAPKR
jgi:hypothetical protein